MKSVEWVRIDVRTLPELATRRMRVLVEDLPHVLWALVHIDRAQLVAVARGWPS